MIRSAGKTFLAILIITQIMVHVSLEHARLLNPEETISLLSVIFALNFFCSI